MFIFPLPRSKIFCPFLGPNKNAQTFLNFNFLFGNVLSKRRCFKISLQIFIIKISVILRKIKTLLRELAANWIELNWKPKNIPDRQQCFQFRKSQNHSTLVGGGGYYYPRYLYEAQFVHYRLSYYASTYDCSSCSKSSMLNYLSKS